MTPTTTPLATAAPTFIRALVLAHYQKLLSPISIYKDQAEVLDVNIWSHTIHTCSNASGPDGGYVGNVPVGATAAYQVYVKYTPRAMRNDPWNFLLFAIMPGKGWILAYEGPLP